MIELGIIDLSAEGRRRVAALIEKWSWASPDSQVATPQISVTLLSPEEVRFNASSDVYLIGPELVSCDVAFLATLRKQLPSKLLVCVLDARTYAFSVVEQLGRLGIDDVLIDSATPDEFFRRLVLLQRRIHAKQKGILSVVSGSRGGVGVTFMTAALAEAFVERKRSVCLVDCDVVSQDLTRSLGVAPHVSEPLRLLLDQQRAVTSEGVLECAAYVWDGVSTFRCVPPSAGGDQMMFAAPKVVRAFQSFLDGLRAHFDEVVVDTASLPVSCVQALYQTADRAVFVANRDPSGAFANRRALSVISGCLRADARLAVVLNDNSVLSASPSLFKREVLITPGHPYSLLVVPKVARAAQWVCTGATPYRFFARSLDGFVSELGGEGNLKPLGMWSLLLRVFDFVRRRYESRSRASSGKKWARVEALAGSSQSELETRYPVVLGEVSRPLEDGQLVSKPMLIQ